MSHKVTHRSADQSLQGSLKQLQGQELPTGEETPPHTIPGETGD
jgi:hypothetical protein